MMRTLTLTRTPLRLSLFGGGTDLPDYYRAFTEMAEFLA